MVIETFIINYNRLVTWQEEGGTRIPEASGTSQWVLEGEQTDDISCYTDVIKDASDDWALSHGGGDHYELHVIMVAPNNIKGTHPWLSASLSFHIDMDTDVVTRWIHTELHIIPCTVDYPGPEGLVTNFTDIELHPTTPEFVGPHTLDYSDYDIELVSNLNDNYVGVQIFLDILTVTNLAYDPDPYDVELVFDGAPDGDSNDVQLIIGGSGEIEPTDAFMDPYLIFTYGVNDPEDGDDDDDDDNDDDDDAAEQAEFWMDEALNWLPFLEQYFPLLVPIVSGTVAVGLALINAYKKYKKDKISQMTTYQKLKYIVQQRRKHKR
jgi:hypothetical protein